MNSPATVLAILIHSAWTGTACFMMNWPTLNLAMRSRTQRPAMPAWTTCCCFTQRATSTKCQECRVRAKVISMTATRQRCPAFSMRRRMLLARRLPPLTRSWKVKQSGLLCRSAGCTTRAEIARRGFAFLMIAVSPPNTCARNTACLRCRRRIPAQETRPATNCLCRYRCASR